MKSSIYSAFLVICLLNNIQAQMPTTNIYSFDLKTNEEKVLVSNPQLLTSFNIEGYNNQPHFIDDDGLLITSNFEASGLTDILHLQLVDKRITRITKTEESEYSAQTMQNGFDFSVVRQGLDDSQPVPQVLWAYPMDRSNGGEQVIPDLINIGYFTWVTKDKVAMFLVESPSELVLYDIRNNTSTKISKNVGRSLKIDRNSNLYYIQNSESGSEIRSYDIYLERSKKIAPGFEGLTDFDMLPNGHLIAGDGSKLKIFNPAKSAVWSEVKDLKSAGITQITRIASSRNRLAVVSKQ